MARNLTDISIHEQTSLREAMAAIDRGAVEIALLVDADGTLVGTLSDGDVRRALLAGATLDQPVAPFAQRHFTAVSPALDRTAVLDLMRARTLTQIPIVDDRGILVGLHLMRDILGSSPRPNWAVIVAGGRGERLRPITDVIPKPMVRVAGRPILERLVLHLVGYGIRRVFLAISYLGATIEEHFGDGEAFGCRIEYLREDSPLGTGGGLSLLPEKPAHPVLVLNGDLLTQVNVDELLRFHDAGGFAATVTVREYVHTVPYGVVRTEGNYVAGLREKPTESWLANAGIYVLSPELIGRVPPNTVVDLPDVVDDCLSRGEPVGAFDLEDDWVDVGHPKHLKEARGQREDT
jgi:dTDP-glucose pyrophosphorylase